MALQVSPVASLSEASSASSLQTSGVPYQEKREFCTWRKHVRDLYQHLVHIDLVWESPSARLMPYMTAKMDLATQTVLCCSRTGGLEQPYIQLLSVTTPNTAELLDRTYETYNDATGEVGGYGMAPGQVGIQVERRMLHDGDPLVARYMHANPLIIASGSSDGNAYIFDWSRISLNKFPNDPPRPRAPLPPNELSANPTDEERTTYHKRMRTLNAVVAEQDRWDKRRGEGQHLLKLLGGNGPCETLDWSVTSDGTLLSGSTGLVCYWHVANMSKDDARTLAPSHTYSLEDSETRVSEVAFSWKEPHVFAVSCDSGPVFYGDVRTPDLLELFSLPCGVTSLSVSPLDGTSLLLGAENGEVLYYDLRKSADAVTIGRMHDGPVSVVQWCPHSRHLFSSGGGDGKCCIYNATSNRLLFKHAGHTENVTDLSWNWQEGFEGHLLSVDSNSLMLWRPRDMFFVS
ncbi:putative WD40 repeat protein [Trypanosoma rangeli]|uniref:Putative WD40 repeat protein n=1 Tax=Trypanosoma rangeli TaxID=5698 RepID=A0A3R7LDW9_TRYRA|nr:putative WD40 repeat protein [Trypanosoma rangeli]RNF12467.1 putative WD40 repeat protein [Trypanosoma rangeli]|eukprot:RNF12467.1 putative WD40 repeat protein [Trypanosoma rangeli]